MLIKLYAAALQGIDATTVTIEVNSSRGIKFFLVGLPDSAVKESHERIISALQVNGYKFPTSHQALKSFHLLINNFGMLWQ